MSTLAEIEAAADGLLPAEQEALLTHLAARLGHGTALGPRQRVRLPLVECGPPGSLLIDEALIARLEAEHDGIRDAASL